jgi:hypothetical protein
MLFFLSSILLLLGNTVVRCSKLYKFKPLFSNVFQLFYLVIAILNKSFSHFYLNFKGELLIISKL